MLLKRRQSDTLGRIADVCSSVFELLETSRLPCPNEEMILRLLVAEEMQI